MSIWRKKIAIWVYFDALLFQCLIIFAILYSWLCQFLRFMNNSALMRWEKFSNSPILGKKTALKTTFNTTQNTLNNTFFSHINVFLTFETEKGRIERWNQVLNLCLCLWKHKSYSKSDTSNYFECSHSFSFPLLFWLYF